MIKAAIKNLIPFSFVLLIVCFSCKNEMRPIEYGKDNCEQCRMTVMDSQFGAGMLTAKGKVLTFDSDECLVKYLKVKGMHDKEKYFVTDYNQPGNLMDATKSTFLHGDSIQSPMGGNLAAFSDKTSAQSVQKVLGGELMSWTELITKK
jgi:copper chaperone NosL